MEQNQTSKLDKWYERIGDVDAQDHLTRISTFDHETWRRWFEKFSKTADTGSIRAMRKLIWYGTEAICQRLRYKLLDGTEVPLCENNDVIVEQAKRTRFVDFTRDFSMNLPEDINNLKHETVVEVVEGDCLEEALRLKELGFNPAVLNMASAKRAGGGYLNGAGAQEENLFRRSNYFQSLEDPEQLDKERSWYYPLPEFSGVYSPEVFVFRESEQKGYGLMPKPVPMAFIAVAAYASPKLQENRKRPPYLGTLVLAENFVEKTKRKMRVILYLALSNAHDAVVLSAMGCGAYKNPPGHIAQLFREVINEPKFRNKFKHISFAIFSESHEVDPMTSPANKSSPDDHNARKAHNPLGNVFPFAEVFKDMSAKNKTKTQTNAKNVAASKANNANSKSSTNNTNSANNTNTTNNAINTKPTHPWTNNNNNTNATSNTNTVPAVTYVSKTTEKVEVQATEPETDQKVINFYRTSEVPYGVFSNFAKYPIKLKDKVWPTTEHYFQAQKFVNTPHEETMRNVKSAGEVAKAGRDRSLPLRADWNEVKEAVMEEALVAKFTQHPQLKKVLLDTKTAVLVEHTSNDSYWADGGDGTGQNRLGYLLMKVRTALQDEIAKKNQAKK